MRIRGVNSLVELRSCSRHTRSLLNWQVPISTENLKGSAKTILDSNLLGARSADDDEMLDLTYYVRLLAPGTAAGLTTQLAALPQVDRVNVFYDEEPL